MSAAPDAPLGDRLDWHGASPAQRVTLLGRYVQVRPVNAAADAEPLYSVSHPPLGDPAIWTYLFDGPFESPEELRRYLADVQENSDPLFFTLVRLPEREPQGVASYLRITPEHGVIEIGNIWFGTPLQRTPAATEAIYLLIRHSFDELGYRRVEWKCNALNSASRRAAERFGFRFEGIFRQHLVIKGRNRDTAWYALTDGEWPSVRDGFERWLDPANFEASGRQRRRLGEFVQAGGRLF
jgi:RimJ/RimL family protein N-acetyltransferase